MMTNYDVLVNSSEEECCKLLEAWKQALKTRTVRKYTSMIH